MAAATEQKKTGQAANKNAGSEQTAESKITVSDELRNTLASDRAVFLWDCTLWKGTHIGDYEIVQHLRSSWTGELYKVVNVHTKMVYAMKLYPPAAAEGDPEFHERFKRSLEGAENRICQGIVHIHKYGCHHDFFDYYYVVYDYIESARGLPETLEEILDFHGKLQEGDVKKFALQLCSALEYAHSIRPEPLIHSDLKPFNILLDKSGVIRLVNFDDVSILGTDYMRRMLSDSMSEVDAASASSRGRKNTYLHCSEVESTTSFLLLNENENKLKYMLDSLFNRIAGGEINGLHTSTHLTSLNNHDGKLIRHMNSVMMNCGNRDLFSSLMNSFEYYSPEQKPGIPPTPQSNIYSLGAILYKMLTGKIVTSSWDLPSASGVSKAWDHIIIKALRNKPDERYRNVTEMRNDISRLHYGGVKIMMLFAIPALLILVTIFGMFFAQNVIDRILGTMKEGFGQEKTVTLLELRNDPLNRFEIMVNLEPKNAKAVIRRDGLFVQGADTVPENGFRFFVDEGVVYELEAETPGYQPFKIQFRPDRTCSVYSFTMSRSITHKEYVWKQDLKQPEIGYPWRIEFLKLDLLPIDPGNFRMGCALPTSAHAGNEETARDVAVKTPFWIADREITQAQYQEIMGKNPSFFKGMDISRAPVERVSWNHAVEFCEKLTTRCRANGQLPAGYVYRLPTEEEWEYCARAGTTSLYCFGDNSAYLNRFAWNKENSTNRTNRTAQLKPNAWGLYDMHGNLWEWCLNLRDNKDTILARGGAWNSPPQMLRSSARLLLKNRDEQFTTVGFRIVLAPEIQPGVQ